MATHEALYEDVMTLVRHVAAEFRRARPDYFDDRLAPRSARLDEAATAARYERFTASFGFCVEGRQAARAVRRVACSGARDRG
jgi:hypothetical protein